MIEDEKFTEVAKTDMKLRIVFGFIFGVIAAIVSIIFIIVGIVTKKNEFVIPLVFMVIVGALVAISCGYFIFRKEKKPDEDKRD